VEKIDVAWLKKLGYNDAATINADIQDFYNHYGDFAISFMYDPETRGLSLYVNNAASNTDAHNHILCQKMIQTVNPLVGAVYAMSGRNISDSWHLRRSDFLVCNTPLSIIYLIGTAKVTYN
jgi:hypothetical protein